MSNSADDDKNGSNDECPLEYYEFKPVDHAVMCPLYTSILSRSADKSIAPDELDLLQSDLETLLAAVNRRMRLLEAETKTLVEWSEKKDKKGTRQRELEIISSITSSFKRKPLTLTDDSKTSKKQKADEGKILKKSKSGILGQESLGIDEDGQITKQKSDAPNRLWAAVEPYCADITVEDLKYVQESMKSQEDDQEFFKIPPLGKHYTERWAQEDLLEEMNEGMKVADPGKKRGTLSSSNTNDGDKVSNVKNIMSKGDSSCMPSDSDACPFGPLTQRLVSALIEENVIAPLSDQSLGETTVKTENDSTSRPSLRGSTKPPHVPHTRTLEARIKEELMHQGLLDCEEDEDDVDDEVLSELRKCQAELKGLIELNMERKQHIYELAQDEMKRQELRRRAQVADAEVLDMYRKYTSLKQKKKSPTKKDKDMIWKVLKEREAVHRVLDNAELLNLNKTT